MDFFLAHWQDLLLIVTSIVTAASIVARLTANVWDDKIVNAILRILSLAPSVPNGKLVQK